MQKKGDGKFVVLDIEMDQKLWDLAGARVNEQCFAHPTGQTMINIAGTLLHLAASSWLAFDQAEGDGPPLTEAVFVQLAGEAYRRAAEDEPERRNQRPSERGRRRKTRASRRVPARRSPPS